MTDHETEVEILRVDRSTWWELIDERARLTPDRALFRDDRGRSLTCREFRDTAERVAAGLWDLGVRPGHTVSWQLPTNIDAPLLAAALSRLGVSQNPVITMLRRAEVGHIVEQLASRWLVVPGLFRGFDHREMAEQITAGRDCTVLVCDATGLGPRQFALPLGAPEILPAFEPTRSELDVRCVLYTSGTTGVPKGVIHTERSVAMASRFLTEVVGIRGDDVFPIAYPFAHIGGLVRLAANLAVGASSPLFEAFDFERTPQVMGELGATLLGSAVPFFHAFLDAQRAHGSEPLYPRLRFGVAGGAPLPSEVIRRFRDELGCAGIMNAWGLTEFPSATSVSPDDPLWAMEETVGRVVSGIELRVVAPDGMVLGPGTEGELRLRGPQRFVGYVDESLDGTAIDDDGFVRTGDLGTVDQHGYVRVTGRLKDVIIRNAENISALEIEGVLFTHPAIASVAVIGLSDERKGERCCAVVVPRTGMQLTLTDLAEHCRNSGLATQKIPEQLEIVDALPINSMGKVLKHELRARFATTRPGPGTT